MLKKVFLVAGGAGLLASLFFGRDAASYVSTTFSRAKDSVRRSVPVEFEIARAQKMLEGLQPEIERGVQEIVREEVELERLAAEIETAEHQLAKSKNEMLRLQADLRSGQKVYRYGSRDFTVTQVKVDLAKRLSRHKSKDTRLDTLRKVYDARSRKLDNSRQKIEEMVGKQRELQVALENVDAKNRMIQVAQTSSKFCFDDSRLGRIKELVNSLETRLEVDERMVDLTYEPFDGIPLEEPVAEDIVDQVTSYFQTDNTVAEVSFEEVH